MAKQYKAVAGVWVRGFGMIHQGDTVSAGHPALKGNEDCFKEIDSDEAPMYDHREEKKAQTHTARQPHSSKE